MFALRLLTCAAIAAAANTQENVNTQAIYSSPFVSDQPLPNQTSKPKNIKIPLKKTAVNRFKQGASSTPAQRDKISRPSLRQADEGDDEEFTEFETDGGDSAESESSQDSSSSISKDSSSGMGDADMAIEAKFAAEDYINMCQDSYYYSYQNCYAVPCNTSLYKSVFFQLDATYMLEVRPEDYILQEKKVPIFDDDGEKTGEEYCSLAFKTNYQNTFTFGVLALQGYAVEFDTTAQTIGFTLSADSTKQAVKDTSDVLFDTVFEIDEETERLTKCQRYGGRYCRDIYDTTWIAKVSSCIGGFLIWFIIFYLGMVCMPDFPDMAPRGKVAQSAKASLKKAKQVVTDACSDLTIIKID